MANKKETIKRVGQYRLGQKIYFPEYDGVYKIREFPTPCSAFLVALMDTWYPGTPSVMRRHIRELMSLTNLMEFEKEENDG